jgi:hypothetical protein
MPAKMLKMRLVLSKSSFNEPDSAAGSAIMAPVNEFDGD